ncbi:hypothetical protein [Aquimarina sp. 2304DJ70-9]|uniref:hypothetical protein n=1 Tax=Aquimarina penaris TaxID=3231044 RepID=UPI0034631EEF
MEKLILLFFISLISCGSSNLEDQKSGDDEKILLAYDYVSQKYDGDILVSNTLVDIDIVNFAEEISKKQKREMSKVLDSLINAKEQYKYEKKKYPIKKLLKKSSKDGSMKLFFSIPQKDYIMVEAFKVEKDLSYDKLTLFGSSDVYLIYFKDNQILEKHQIKLDYN